MAKINRVLSNRSQMNEDEFKPIEKLHCVYGDVVFNMAVSNLFDHGYEKFREVTSEDIEEQYQSWIKEDEENRKKKVISMMTPEFKRDLTLVSKELSQYSTWDLLKYIFIG